MNMFAHLLCANNWIVSLCWVNIEPSRFLQDPGSDLQPDVQDWAPALPHTGVYYDRDMEYIRDQVHI